MLKRRLLLGLLVFTCISLLPAEPHGLSGRLLAAGPAPTPTTGMRLVVGLRNHDDVAWLYDLSAARGMAVLEINKDLGFAVLQAPEVSGRKSASQPGERRSRALR